MSSPHYINQMQFRRLNNITGMDANLNRRFASIYINEFESLKNAIEVLKDAKNADQAIEALHKLKPGMVIFEHEGIIPEFEKLIERKKKKEISLTEDTAVNELLLKSETIISQMKSFIKTLS